MVLVVLEVVLVVLKVVLVVLVVVLVVRMVEPNHPNRPSRCCMPTIENPFCHCHWGTPLRRNPSKDSLESLVRKLGDGGAQRR